MHGLLNRIFALAAISIAVPALSGQEAPDRAVFGTTTVTHVGVVVRDVETAAKAFADVFGVKVAQVRRDRATRGQIAHVQFDNMLVELAQPEDGPSLWRDFLDTHGEGIHHVGFDVTDLDAHVRLLQSKGGRPVPGHASDSHAFVDVMPHLGITIELRKVQTAAAPQSQPTGSGLKTLARIGMMTSDGDKFKNAWAGLFNVPVAPAVESKGRTLRFPTDFQGDPTASNREIYVPLDNMWVNIIQPVGGKSPWRDLLEKREGFHYLNFYVDDVDAGAKHLESRGGRRTLGNEGAPYAYVDMPRLGVTILLLKTRPPA